MIYALLILAAAAALWFVLRRKPEPQGWQVGPLVKGENYSRGVELWPPPDLPTRSTPGRIWAATIEPGDELDGVTRARGAVGGTIRLRYRVTGSVFPSEAPAEPAGLTLFIQRAGDTWSATGKFASYRFYSTAFLPLEAGEHDAAIPLTQEHWHNTRGAGASDLPAEFAAVLAAQGRIGLAFGWRGGRMHGVCCETPATFELLEWSAA
jgi:hypothetical protein